MTFRRHTFPRGFPFVLIWKSKDDEHVVHGHGTLLVCEEIGEFEPLLVCSTGSVTVLHRCRNESVRLVSDRMEASVTLVRIVLTVGLVHRLSKRIVAGSISELSLTLSFVVVDEGSVVERPRETFERRGSNQMRGEVVVAAVEQRWIV